MNLTHEEMKLVLETLKDWPVGIPTSSWAKCSYDDVDDVDEKDL